jgi:hypothetical protein
MHSYIDAKNAKIELLDWVSFLDQVTPCAGEYDEPSLVFVLNQESYNLEFLSPKWNVWKDNGYNSKEVYFVQNHIGEYNMYKYTPKFKNEA